MKTWYNILYYVISNEVDPESKQLWAEEQHVEEPNLQNLQNLQKGTHSPNNNNSKVGNNNRKDPSFSMQQQCRNFLSARNNIRCTVQVPFLSRIGCTSSIRTGDTKRSVQ
jgi:hypothetical protein